jgi:hypothetical protein
MAVAAARHVSFGERQHAVVVKFVRNGAWRMVFQIEGAMNDFLSKSRLSVLHRYRLFQGSYL